MSTEEGGTERVVDIGSQIVLTLGVSSTVLSTEFLGISVVSTVVSVVAVVVVAVVVVAVVVVVVVAVVVVAVVVVAVVVVAVIVVAVLAIGVLEFVCVVQFGLTNAVFRLFAVDIFKLEVFNS